MSRATSVVSCHPAHYYTIETGHGDLHVHVSFGEKGVAKVFTNISPVGTEVAGLTSAIGILISKYLEAGGTADKVVKHLSSIRGDKPAGFGDKIVGSIPAAVAGVLRRCIEEEKALVPA